jgi:hypothetical protein
MGLCLRPSGRGVVLFALRGEWVFGNRHGQDSGFQSSIQLVRRRLGFFLGAAPDVLAVEPLLGGRQKHAAGRLLGQLLGGSWMFGAAFMIF